MFFVVILSRQALCCAGIPMWLCTWQNPLAIQEEFDIIILMR